MKQMNPIKALVIGATGHQGGAVARWTHLDFPRTGAGTRVEREAAFGEVQGHDKMLERRQEWIQRTRLKQLDVPLVVIEPILMKAEEITAPGSLLGQIVPLILVLMTVTGAISLLNRPCSMASLARVTEAIANAS